MQGYNLNMMNKMILSRLKSIKIIKKYLKIFSRDIKNCEEITRIDLFRDIVRVTRTCNFLLEILKEKSL